MAPSDYCEEESGQCLHPTTVHGGTIEAPYDIDPGAIPMVLSGDTSSAQNNYSFVNGACPPFQGKGGASNDQVWRFVPIKSGDYVFDLMPDGFDAALYVVTSEDINNSCVAAWDGEPNDRLVVSLEADKAVYVIVDGGSNLLNYAGPYQLGLSGP